MSACTFLTTELFFLLSSAIIFTLHAANTKLFAKFIIQSSFLTNFNDQIDSASASPKKFRMAAILVANARANMGAGASSEAESNFFAKIPRSETLVFDLELGCLLLG
jgi:hypothetical protein